MVENTYINNKSSSMRLTNQSVLDLYLETICSGNVDLSLEATREVIMHVAPETDMMAQDVMPSYRHGAVNSRLN